ncbi:unnamed protein product, partial [Acanthoscelides obtectus]
SSSVQALRNAVGSNEGSIAFFTASAKRSTALKRKTRRIPNHSMCETLWPRDLILCSNLRAILENCRVPLQYYIKLERPRSSSKAES